MPVVEGTEVAPVPEHVRNAEQRDLRRLKVFHRVRHESGIGVLVNAVRPAHGKLAPDEVVHRPVPPDKRRAPQRLSPLCRGISGDVAAYAHSRPHDQDVLVGLLSKYLAVCILVVPDILIGTHDKRRTVALAVEKVALYAIADFGMKFGVGISKVVKEDGEAAEADVVHGIELAPERGVFRLAGGRFRILEGVAEMHGPVELHVVLPRRI